MDAILSDDPNEISTHVHTLAKQYGAWPLDFEWSSMKRALGKAKAHPNGEVRIIKLSKPTFVDLGMRTLIDHGVSRALLEDVIRHEIAHILEYEEFGNGGHGRTWKMVARRVEANPTRTTHMPESVEKLMAPYYRECSMCGKQYDYLYRKPGKNANWRYCPDCAEDGYMAYNCKLELHDNPDQIV